MVAFIKDFRTWETRPGPVPILDYDLVIDSLEKELSSVTVPSRSISRSDAGNWLIMSGSVYMISQVKPQEHQAELTLLSPLDAFSRLIPYEEQPEGQTVGGFVAAMLQKHWVYCTDPVYAIPYLTVSNSDTVPLVPPELGNNGLVDIPAYCRLMRRTHRVKVSFELAGKNLHCRIAQSPAVAHQVSFSDGRSQLKRVDYSTATTAKITAIQEGVETTWYLSDSGEISQDVPAVRAAGSWQTITVPANADVAEKVTETFAKGRSGSKVEFMSKLDLAVLSDCTFMIYGELLRSHISCKRKRYNDSRFYYKAGELATTATEKLRGVIA